MKLPHLEQESAGKGPLQRKMRRSTIAIADQITVPPWPELTLESPGNPFSFTACFNQSLLD
jgi:hypothetical protein